MNTRPYCYQWRSADLALALYRLAQQRKEKAR